MVAALDRKSTGPCTIIDTLWAFKGVLCKYRIILRRNRTLSAREVRWDEDGAGKALRLPVRYFELHAPAISTHDTRKTYVYRLRRYHEFLSYFKSFHARTP